MNPILLKCLPHLALFSYFLALSPVMFIAARLAKRPYSLQAFFFDALIIFIASYLGYLQKAIKKEVLSKTKLHFLIQKGLILLGYIVTTSLFLWCCILKYSQDRWLGICLFLTCLLLYNKYHKSYGVHYSVIYKWEVLTITVVIYIPVLIIYKLPVLGLCFIVLTAIYILIRNQATLEELLEHSQRNTPMIASIEKTNLKWLCAIMSLVFIAYPFRHIIGDLLLTLCRTVLYIISTILNFLLNLFINTPSEDTTLKGQPINPFDGAEPLVIGNITRFILWAILLVILFMLRRSIWNSIKEVLYGTKKLLLAIYHLIFNDKQTYNKKITPFYDEVTEKLSTSTTFKIKKETLNKRSWRKQYKAFQKLPNNVAKYRQGFKLALEGFQLKGLQILPPHTVRDISRNISAHSTLPSFTKDTKTYEDIRYGEGDITPHDLPQLETTLQALSSSLTSNPSKAKRL